MKLYVNCNAKAGGDGSKEHPFIKIQQAAEIAKAGDEVIVAPGIYREEVNPVNKGTKESPVVYCSEVMGAAVITGAEIVKNWEQIEGNLWKTVISNECFYNDGKYFNPYTSFVEGDWLNILIPIHRGEVFLNGKALYEKDTLDKVVNPEYYDASWDREFTKHTWYTCQSEDGRETVIYANFQGKNPNEECVEVTFRQHCFYPEKEHVDYITLKGFVATKAATQWAPPTALQDGMVGPHWSKGWIIEDCEISDAKCCGISLGKYYQEGNNNKWSSYKYKDGTQTQRDCAFIAQLDGWSRETVGSHIVRNCNIHDCGQNAITGNLGCVFSIIENNHIHHINNRRNIAGAEVSGIKFHAPIDVIIRNNHIHHCVRGIWLDWQAQGSRITANLFHDNCMPYDYLLKPENKEGLGLGEDLFIEVAHGPTLVDNNIFLSERAIKLPTQGVAFVHNLIAGSITAVGRGVKNGSVIYDSTRYTPVHRPHSTDITGIMSILHGDVKLYNNVFIQPKVRQGLIDICEEEKTGEWDNGCLEAGTSAFNGFLTEEEWKSHFAGYCGEGSTDTRDKYYMPLPVWTGGNAFFNGAKPWDKETDFFEDKSHEVSVSLNFKDGKPQLVTDIMEYLPECSMINTDTLGIAFEPEQRYEGPDGEDIIFDTDFYGNNRQGCIIPGPFAV